MTVMGRRASPVGRHYDEAASPAMTLPGEEVVVGLGGCPCFLGAIGVDAPVFSGVQEGPERIRPMCACGDGDLI